MNPEFLKPLLKDAIAKSLKSGGSTFIEELADALPTEQLGGLIDILKKVHKKKTETITTQVNP